MVEALKNLPSLFSCTVSSKLTTLRERDRERRKVSGASYTFSLTYKHAQKHTQRNRKHHLLSDYPALHHG